MITLMLALLAEIAFRIMLAFAIYRGLLWVNRFYERGVLKRQMKRFVRAL